MRRINSNAKGKRGERELAHILRMAGYEARRSQQYAGVAGAEDLTHTVPGMHLECKRRNRGSLTEWYGQAVADALPHKTPAVVHRADRQPWMVTLSLEDFLSLMRCSNGLDV